MTRILRRPGESIQEANLRLQQFQQRRKELQMERKKYLSQLKIKYPDRDWTKKKVIKEALRGRLQIKPVAPDPKQPENIYPQRESSSPRQEARIQPIEKRRPRWVRPPGDESPKPNRSTGRTGPKRPSTEQTKRKLAEKYKLTGGRKVSKKSNSKKRRVTGNTLNI